MVLYLLFEFTSYLIEYYFTNKILINIVIGLLVTLHFACANNLHYNMNKNALQLLKFKFLMYFMCNSRMVNRKIIIFLN